MDQPFKQEPVENLDSVVLPLRPPHSALIKHSCKFTWVVVALEVVGHQFIAISVHCRVSLSGRNLSHLHLEKNSLRLQAA